MGRYGWSYHLGGFILQKYQTSNQPKPCLCRDLAFVYPNGCSLNVTAPALPILSSGWVSDSLQVPQKNVIRMAIHAPICILRTHSWSYGNLLNYCSQISYPVNRPIGAVAKTSNGKGRICCIGSLNMFSDEWLVKENNTRIVEVIVFCCERVFWCWIGMRAHLPPFFARNLLPFIYDVYGLYNCVVSFPYYQLLPCHSKSTYRYTFLRSMQLRFLAFILILFVAI